jgi:glutamate---cysteine ligase / carboxylate-amine ligase
VIRQVGVEEELLLVDPDTGCPQALAGAALEHAAARLQDDDEPGGVVEEEFQQEQIEIATRPCRSLDEVGTEVRRWRRAAAEAAQAAGGELAAMGTTPLPVEPTITPKPRYGRMLREFGLTAAEQLSCGCHVHVEVDSDDEGVAVLDRIRVWLPVLIAMTANSPFHQGSDSGYDSYRSQVWNRWPAAGPYDLFGSAERYHRTVESLVATGTLLDPGMVYFDARLSDVYPTVEIRVADVCLDPDDAVLLAALCRGLVSTAAAEARDGTPPPDVRTDVLRVATWRAGRSGLRDTLVDPRSMKPAPAGHVVDALVDHVRPALDEAGDLEAVRRLLGQLRERGNGAALQRAAYAETGQLRDVVRAAVARTTGDC